ncbi:MAG: dockerin type I repeat-containing protein, partial [Oscillospiraceae bacterium]|nr:dockerin type I repeat-containing protein [Oscillospiraceae bacterium]
GEERRSCANCDYYESKEIAAYRYGDVNCDGKVNTVDANYVRRYSAGLLTLDERQMLAADVDGNGAINVLDSAFIRRHTVKLINIFPAEENAG